MDTTHQSLRGPVLRASLRANAAPFTPQKYGSSNATSSSSSLHASQPTISRRHSQNPSFHTTPVKRSSLHGTGFRSPQPQPPVQSPYHVLAANDQNNPNAANPNLQYSTQQKQATSFACDAFIKKNAAKAYAAKKRAMDRLEAGKTPEQRKSDAQKGFARRQSLKQAKKLAQSAATKIAESPNPERSTSSSAVSALTTSEASSEIPMLTSQHFKALPLSTNSASSSARLESTLPISVASLLESTANMSIKQELEEDIEMHSILKPSTNVNIVQKTVPVDKPASLAPKPSLTDRINDRITDRVMTPLDLHPREPVLQKVQLQKAELKKMKLEKVEPEKVRLQKPSLSIENLNSMNIGPVTPPTPPLSAPTLAPLALPRPTPLCQPPSCSVDIGAMSRLSNVSSCNSSDGATGCRNGCSSATSRNRETVSMPSSGKWCPECAGVGLHVAALLTELAQWRADDERRSSSSSSNGASSTTVAKSGWKRMMSQTLIGESRSTRGAQERNRLQQQVDVLTTTVQFLYEKLQNSGSAGPDVRAAFERCGVRSNR